MRVEVYEKNEKQDEKIIRLKLERRSGYVALRAVAEDGRPIPGGGILIINDDGTIFRCSNISPEIGFPLDGRNRVILK